MDKGILRAFSLGVIALCSMAAIGAPALCDQKTPPGYEGLSFEEPLSWPEPRVETFTLQNGVRFLLIQDNELPLIQVQVLVRSGEFHVPPEKAGLAEISGMVMRSGGSRHYPPQKLNRLLADRAATMETSFDFISGKAAMNVLSEDFQDLLPVFVGFLKQPVFPEDKIALAKQQLKTDIARRNDEQSRIAMRTYKRLIYGEDSVYAREPEYETVENINRDDLIDFHQRAYQGANLIVGIVGDFDSGAILPLIKGEFSVFPAGEKIEVNLPAVESRQASSLQVVGKKDVNQTYLLMGHLGGRRPNPDFAALQIMNTILSGGFSGRLFEKVRTEMGLVYSVFGRYECKFFYPGMFFVALKTRTSATTEAISVVKKVIEQLQQGIDPDELEQAKDRFFNSLVFQYDQAEEILERRMYYAYRDMDPDRFRKLIQEIRRITAEDVVRVAREYLKPASLTVLAVGEKEKLLQQLEKVSQVKVLPQP